MNYEWGFQVGLYLFIAGIAGGTYFVAAVAELFGNERDKKVAKIGYYIAFPTIIIGAIVITLDLGNPDRVWRLFVNFKVSSPMSVGSWSILIFGIFSFLGMVMSKIENPLKKAITWIGIMVAVYLVLYTGVLLGSTSQALWTSTYLLGALFLASGVSTGIASISLIAGGKEELKDSIKKLERADKKAMIVEIVILSLFIVVLYLSGAETRLALNRLISGQNGIFFWGGVVVLGLLLPLVTLYKRGRPIVVTNIMMLLILIGGFVMRYVLLIAGQV